MSTVNQAVQMRHEAVTILIDEERDLILIRQPIPGDPDGEVEIQITPEQSAAIAKLLAKFGKRHIVAPDLPAPTSHWFEHWWQAYPAKRRIDKSTCKRLWTQKNLDAQGETIINHTKSMALSHDWTKDAGRFCPLSTTYLRQERYAMTEEAGNQWQPMII
jgi:hypothetical protein